MLGEVSSAFLPSKKASWTLKFRPLGVGQQYPTVLETLHKSAQKMVRINGAATLARVYTPPETLSARVPNTAERVALKKACLAQLSESSVITVVHDLVRFYDLLARPENHIRVPSTQYREREVNTYTTQEMTNQMAKELMNLPHRTAYAKIVSLAPGSESVWTGKMQIIELHGAPACGADVARRALDNAIKHGILRKRSVIEAEIRKRQEQWKRDAGKALSPPAHENEKPDVPPPTSF